MDSITYQSIIQSQKNDVLLTEIFDLGRVIPREHVERYVHLIQRSQQTHLPKGA